MWAIEIEIKPVGKKYNIITRDSPFGTLVLHPRSRVFEEAVTERIRQVVPVLGQALIGLKVTMIKKRPKTLHSLFPGRIYCPVTPDATNLQKSVEDALMRCRHCLKQKPTAKGGCKGDGHSFAPTIEDDRRVCMVSTTKYYSALATLGSRKKDIRSKPDRIIVEVRTLQQPT